LDYPWVSARKIINNVPNSKFFSLKNVKKIKKNIIPS